MLTLLETGSRLHRTIEECLELLLYMRCDTKPGKMQKLDAATLAPIDGWFVLSQL